MPKIIMTIEFDTVEEVASFFAHKTPGAPWPAPTETKPPKAGRSASSTGAAPAATTEPSGPVTTQPAPMAAEALAPIAAESPAPTLIAPSAATLTQPTTAAQTAAPAPAADPLAECRAAMNAYMAVPGRDAVGARSIMMNYAGATKLKDIPADKIAAVTAAFKAGQ